MKYCQNCNAPLGDNANFCQRCGQPITDSNPMPPIPPVSTVPPIPPVPPVSQPSQSWTQPEAEKQRSKGLIVSLVAVTVVLICGVLAYIFIGSSDKVAESTVESNEVFNTETVDDENPYEWLSQRAVTAADLSGKTAGDLRLMRNAIFARHGYIFKTKDLQEYFQNFSWYTPRYADVTAMLSPLEIKNIEFIKKFEGRARNAY